VTIKCVHSNLPKEMCFGYNLIRIIEAFLEIKPLLTGIDDFFKIIGISTAGVPSDHIDNCNEMTSGKYILNHRLELVKQRHMDTRYFEIRVRLINGTSN
jgi:hypothetical protein